ncbi:hypothetical protein WDU94_011593 [Cyamophila willieti]
MTEVFIVGIIFELLKYKRSPKMLTSYSHLQLTLIISLNCLFYLFPLTLSSAITPKGNGTSTTQDPKTLLPKQAFTICEVSNTKICDGKVGKGDPICEELAKKAGGSFPWCKAYNCCTMKFKVDYYIQAVGISYQKKYIDAPENGIMFEKCPNGVIMYEMEI